MKRVYFIKPVGMDGPIKIGCTDDARGRLADLMAKSPFPLEIAATLPGDHILEARLHRRFIASNSHSEWFIWSPDLQSIIDDVVGGLFDPALLPEPLFLNSKGGRMVASIHRERLRSLTAIDGALSAIEQGQAA